MTIRVTMLLEAVKKTFLLIHVYKPFIGLAPGLWVAIQLRIAKLLFLREGDVCNSFLTAVIVENLMFFVETVTLQKYLNQSFAKTVLGKSI